MKEIVIEIKGKKWEEAIDKAAKTAGEKITVDGFRKGKAPKEAVIKKYGEMQTLFDAADLVLADAYKEMSEKNKDDKIASEPKMDIKKIDRKSLELIFKLVLKPTVKLGKYKNLKVKKEEVKVTKEEVKISLDNLLNRYAEIVPKEGKSKLGDTVVIDFEGFLGDTPFEGGKGENYSLKLGSGTFIPGFEDELVGYKKNDKVDVKVTFPKDYGSKELQGKDAVFKVLIHEVKETVIPKLDEDFFKDLNLEGIDSKEKLECMLKDNLMAEKEMHATNKYMDELLEKAAKNVKVEIPEEMVNDETNRMVHQYSEHLAMQGITLEQFYQFTGSDEAALKDQMKEEAEKRVLYRLMLEEIVVAEKIKVTDKEVDAETSRLAKQYNMPEEELLKAFGGKELVKYDLEMRKAMEVLKEDDK